VFGPTHNITKHILLLPRSVLQVIGNTGSNSTGEALHATEQGFAVGMHAALQINPYYGKTSKAGLVAHFDAVLKEGPAIIYNVPGRTGQDIPDDIVHHIASHPNFLGMKECTGNERIGKYTKQVRRGVYGAHKVISVEQGKPEQCARVPGAAVGAGVRSWGAAPCSADTSIGSCRQRCSAPVRPHSAAAEHTAPCICCNNPALP
jgi:hypothetical protein